MSLFAHPVYFLWALLTLGVLAFVLRVSLKRKDRITRELFGGAAYDAMFAKVWRKGQNIKEILFFAALFFIFTAMAAPQWGLEKIKATAGASYVVLAVDVSSSMKATDLKPDRIENAKVMLKMLSESLPQSRIGIVAFTSEAYTQCPITSDTRALKYFIDGLRADMLHAKGTSVSAAVNKGVYMLSRYPGKKAIVLLTDGEDHDPEKIKAAVALAKENNVRVVSVGIGSTEGELIPEVIKNGKPSEYKKDKDGKTVVTKLNEIPLLELAKGTEGVYIKYQSSQAALNQVQRALSDLDKETRSSNLRNIYKNRYQIPLFIALILLAGWVFMPGVKKEKK